MTNSHLNEELPTKHSNEELQSLLKAAETRARIQTAKLEHQMKRFAKLAASHESLERELQDQQDRSQQALAQEKRQKELVLSQMAELENDCLVLMQQLQEAKLQLDPSGPKLVVSQKAG